MMALSFGKIQGPDWIAQLNKNFETIAAAELIELASDEEATTGTSTTKGVTPANLAAAVTTHVSAASAATAGKVELATNAETLAGSDTARALTAANLAHVESKIIVWSFAGHSGAGACTLTGAKVGDVVESVTGIAAGTAGDQSGKFETTITVADQIQQSDSGNLSANIYLVRLLRKS